MMTSCLQNNVTLSESSDMKPSEIISAKRQRTKSPVRSLPAASHQSSVNDSRGDDDVPCLSDCAADVAESFVPINCVPDDADTDAAFLLLWLGKPREEVSSWELDESTAQALRPVADAGFGAAPGPSLSRSSCRVSRVRFAPDPVSDVKVIPSHRSLTAEEKHAMYRGKLTVHVEKEIARVERKFERSRYCSENALEEECFFRDLLGELVHPAHWVAFVRDSYPSFARDPFVPPGFSSAKEYYDHLSKYKRFYRKAVEANDFPPPEL